MPPCSMAGVDFLMSALDGSSSRSFLGTSNSFFSVLSSMLTSTSPIGEDADAQCDELDAAGQLDLAAGEALLTREQIGADGGQEQPDEHRDEALEHRVAGQHDHQQQREHHQRRVLRRSEVDRDVGGQRSQECQADDADACPRRTRRSPRCRAPCPRDPVGHLVAVDTRDDRRGLAGDVQQDRRRRPAVLGAVVDAGHHDQTGRRVEPGGHRQQDRDRRQAARGRAGCRRACPAGSRRSATAGWSA